MGPIWRWFFWWVDFCKGTPPKPPIPKRFLFFFPGFSLWASFWKCINWWKAKSEGISTTNNPVILRFLAVLNSSSFRNGKYIKIPNDQIAPQISHASQSWPKWLCSPDEKNKNTSSRSWSHRLDPSWTQKFPQIRRLLEVGGLRQSANMSRA